MEILAVDFDFISSLLLVRFRAVGCSSAHFMHSSIIIVFNDSFAYCVHVQAIQTSTGLRVPARFTEC